MQYEMPKVQYPVPLQRARPATKEEDNEGSVGSEDLVKDMEKMDVDSEAKSKDVEEGDKKTDEDEKKRKEAHFAVVKKLQKYIQELIEEKEKEDEKKENVNVEMKTASVVTAN